MQIGCDQKRIPRLASSRKRMKRCDLYNEKSRTSNSKEHDHGRLSGVICVEAGGETPEPCAGRGIITALEKLKTGAYKTYKPGYCRYDVLGMLFAGAFSMPMRKDMRTKFLLSHRENMAIHAKLQYCHGSTNFKNRGYLALGGIILNRRNVKREEEKVIRELAEDF